MNTCMVYSKGGSRYVGFFLNQVPKNHNVPFPDFKRTLKKWVFTRETLPYIMSQRYTGEAMYFLKPLRKWCYVKTEVICSNSLIKLADLRISLLIEIAWPEIWSIHLLSKPIFICFNLPSDLICNTYYGKSKKDSLNIVGRVNFVSLQVHISTSV